MIESEVISLIEKRFGEMGNPAEIPLLKGGRTFMARLSTEGIYVSNLSGQPFLPWEVFTETVGLLKRNNGRAFRGNYNYKLGSPELPLDSVEGYIANKVYGKEIGDSVFRRISPIACILIWSGICRHEPGELVLSGVV